jgi:DNA-binding NarL/FixJ family response regulator
MQNLFFNVACCQKKSARRAKLARQIMDIRPDLPVILCTGFSERISEERAKKNGIREFILKPLGMDKLANAVRAVLDGGSRESHKNKTGLKWLPIT